MEEKTELSRMNVPYIPISMTAAIPTYSQYSNRENDDQPSAFRVPPVSNTPIDGPTAFRHSEAPSIASESHALEPTGLDDGHSKQVISQGKMNGQAWFRYVQMLGFKNLGQRSWNGYCWYLVLDMPGKHPRNCNMLVSLSPS